MALRQREVFAKRLPLYRKDPCLFFKEVTRFKPDKWQKEAATAIAQHRKVSIRSGQGVGKQLLKQTWCSGSWLASRIPASCARHRPASS